MTGSLVEAYRANIMMKNPVLDLPLTEVMRPEIALTLQQVLRVHTVGSFLRTWRTHKGQKSIEQFFDNPQQARHAAAVCAAWLGMKIPATHGLASGAWWVDEPQPAHRMSV